LRYDAAIIGAGSEGLAAATLLGQAGLRVLVVERAERAGGRAITREFYPGFRASPFADELASIPPELYWALDLARRGAVFASPRHSLALWSDRRHVLTLQNDAQSAAGRLLAHSAALRRAVLARAGREAETAPKRLAWARRPPRDEIWPGEDWTTQSLCAVLAERIGESDARAHLAALALGARGGDPSLPGSALHLLLAGASGGRVSGGLARLADALFDAARAAGAEFCFGLEASDIQRRDGKIIALGLADGSQIETGRIISTLDLKRTFLNFFAWNALPKQVARRAANFRIAGAAARVLFALEGRPPLPLAADVEIHAAPDLARMIAAAQAWRAGILADELPLSLRVVSDADPTAAPPGGSVVTATLGAVPFRLYDGGWTHEKRAVLRERAIAAADRVMPGFAQQVIAAEIVAPPDFEEALGATEGDLLGGEIAGDQMLNAQLWPRQRIPRTPIAGLYLAGSHLTLGAIATGVAGAAAARALLTDAAQGWKR
jgi:phytoene dehydrogenase-like protein